MWHEEPEGWSHLQSMAQRERNPKRLIEIIDLMHRLLDEHENRAKRRDIRRASGGSPSESFSD